MTQPVDVPSVLEKCSTCLEQNTNSIKIYIVGVYARKRGK